MSHYDSLRSRLADRSAVVGVVGLGYVGLPLVQAFVRAGYRVLGFDVDPRKIERLAAGESYIKHVPAGVDSRVARGGAIRRDDRLAAALRAGRDPDLRPHAAHRQPRSGPGIHRIDEPPDRGGAPAGPAGGAREHDVSGHDARSRPAAFGRHGARAGKRLFSGLQSGARGSRESPIHGVADSQGGRRDGGAPSRAGGDAVRRRGGRGRTGVELRGGRGLQDLGEHVSLGEHRDGQRAEGALQSHRTRHLGGDRGGEDQAVRVPGVLSRSGARRALYSDRPVSFELAGAAPRAADAVHRAGGRDQHEHAAVRRGPRGGSAELRGPAVRRSRIALLGAAYKRDVDDPRESPSFNLLELLQERGAELTYNDPHVPVLPRMRHYDLPPLASQPLTAEYLAAQNCVLIATDHSAYDDELIVRHSRLIVDARNATAGVREGREKIRRA